MKCGAEKNTTCMARHGDQCMEHLMTDTPSCSSRVAITNADRIRSMSDEELAKTLAYDDFFYEEICGSDERTRVCDNDCVVCALGWLRQPAKEEPNEAD